MATIAEEAVQSARELFALVSRDRIRVLAAGKASVVASRLFEELPAKVTDANHIEPTKIDHLAHWFVELSTMALEERFELPTRRLTAVCSAD